MQLCLKALQPHSTLYFICYSHLLNFILSSISGICNTQLNLNLNIAKQNQPKVRESKGQVVNKYFDYIGVNVYYVIVLLSVLLKITPLSLHLHVCMQPLISPSRTKHFVLPHKGYVITPSDTRLLCS